MDVMGGTLSSIARLAVPGHGLQNPSCFSPSAPRHVQTITVSRIARAGLAQACPHTIHALVHHGVPWNQLKKIQQWPKCCLVCCYLLFVVSSLFVLSFSTKWLQESFGECGSGFWILTIKGWPTKHTTKSLALTPHYPSTPPLPDYWLFVHSHLAC